MWGWGDVWEVANMTMVRKLGSLGPGEKAIVRHSAGSRKRVANEFVVEGGDAGKVIWRSVNHAGWQIAGSATVLDLNQQELKSCDNYLDYLRSAPEDRGTTTAAPRLVVEWFEGIRMNCREEFPNAEPDERTLAAFFEIIQRLNLERSEQG